MTVSTKVEITSNAAWSSSAENLALSNSSRASQHGRRPLEMDIIELTQFAKAKLNANEQDFTNKTQVVVALHWIMPHSVV